MFMLGYISLCFMPDGTENMIQEKFNCVSVTLSLSED